MKGEIINGQGIVGHAVSVTITTLLWWCKSSRRHYLGGERHGVPTEQMTGWIRPKCYSLLTLEFKQQNRGFAYISAA